MKFLGKLVKILVWTAVCLLVAVLLLPLWIGPVGKFAANTAVPKIAGVPFHLGELSLNQYSGRLHVGDMRLQNPERFYTASAKNAMSVSEVKGDGVLGTIAAHAGNAVSAAGDALSAVGDALASSETNAVALGSLDVSFSTLSALTDTVRIGEIKIENLYFYGDLTFANIREIAANASGGKDGEAGKKAAEPATEEKAEGGKKVVIDRVFVTGTKIQWGHAAVSLPDIEIRDIGKEDGGTDGDGAFKAIVDGICDAADKACAGAGTALKVALEGADAAAGAAGSAVKSAGEAVGSTVDAVKGLFK